MMKKIKRVLACAVFAALAALLLAGLVLVLQPNKTEPGVYSWKSYRKLADGSVDALFIGSSHAYSGFDCAVLYEKYGISAFDLCASGQQMWNSYYTLKEALKTQTPKVIVLEAYLTIYDQDYDDGAGLNLIGMPYTENRIGAIQASLPPEQRIDYYLPWIAYHGCYNELSRQDFAPELHETDATESALGSCHLWRTTVNQPQTYENTGATEALYPKVEQYYRACIELAREKQIPIVVTVLPYVNAQEDMAKHNEAAEIAAEYGVPFINMNEQYDALGMDFTSDWADWAHLNYKGADKVMTALGAELQQDYSLPNHKGDSAFSHWAQNAAYYDQLKLDALLQQAFDLSDFTQILRMGQAHYTFALDVSADAALGGHAAELEDLGLPAPQGGMTALVSGGWAQELMDGGTLAFSAADTDWLLEKQDGTTQARSAAETLTMPDKNCGISFLVWDDLSRQMVASVSFERADDYTREPEAN